MTEGETRALVARLREADEELMDDYMDHAPCRVAIREAADRLAVCLDVAQEMRNWPGRAANYRIVVWADRLAGLPAPATQESE